LRCNSVGASSGIAEIRKVLCAIAPEDRPRQAPIMSNCKKLFEIHLLSKFNIFYPLVIGL